MSDSSVAGAGFWADGEVALSATGDGDRFIATSLARTVPAFCFLQTA